MQRVVQPYIGIVGVKNVSESMAAASAIKGALAGREVPHVPQLGVQVTRTTLAGGESSTSRRNPVVTDIPLMFRTARRIVPELFTVVHFTPKDPAIVAESVRKIFTMDDMYESGVCQGLQLNGQFGKITPEILTDITCEFPELKIILQLHRTVLETMPVKDLISKLKELEGQVDYVLIDPSGGRGEEMDLDAGASFGKKLMERTSLCVGFAGGLKGENVRGIVSELTQRTGTNLFAIDAEGGLRDKAGEGYGNDDFNIRKAERYFTEALEGFYPST